MLPLAEEVEPLHPGRDDPLEEARFEVAPGVFRKYRGRVLLTACGACALHCRYCFRRVGPRGGSRPLVERLDGLAEVLAGEPGGGEVVLSGGDPLCLTGRPLGELLARIDGLPGPPRVRIHTRVPVALPARVDAPLLEQLAALSRPPVVVIHANHPAEIDQEVARALGRLRVAGALLLNQSVLLRGVNDAPEPLARLSRRLVDSGVLPYYLHLLDPVTGAMHLEVPETEGRELVRCLREVLPGYAVPRLVREVPGEACKRPVEGEGRGA